MLALGGLLAVLATVVYALGVPVAGVPRFEPPLRLVVGIHGLNAALVVAVFFLLAVSYRERCLSRPLGYSALASLTAFAFVGALLSGATHSAQSLLTGSASGFMVLGVGVLIVERAYSRRSSFPKRWHAVLWVVIVVVTLVIHVYLALLGALPY